MAQSLRILVAGAGIGGLATALACSRAGHSVRIFEQTAALEPLGAGIQLGPNVTRILRQWGLANSLSSVAATPARLVVRDAHSGAVLGQLRLGDEMVQRYGAPYVTLHRADLQGLLADALARLQVSGKVPDIAFGHAVDSFSQDAMAVQLRLKTTNSHASAPHADVQGDLLVGADGLWSRVRNALLGDGVPNSTGHKALRSLIRRSDLPAALRQRVNSDDVGVWLGPNLHVVHYPVRGGEWVNLVVIVANKQRQPASEWSQPVDSTDLDPVLAGLFGMLRNLLTLPGQQSATSPEWRQWDLFSRSPMQSAQSHGLGRVALLGDAAHPMLPFLAQGAGMAIEDAQGLCEALAPTRQSADISTQLQAFGQARWQRNARVQARSMRNGKIFHTSGAMRWARDAAMKMLGERILDVPWLYRGG